MKNKKKIMLLAIILFIIICIGILTYNIFIAKIKKQENDYNVNKELNYTEKIEQEYLKNKENLITYQENSTIEELKKEYKINGNDELYQIETEKDGRRVINIKPIVNYKVSFSGMIKKNKPNFEEIDEIYEKSHPLKKGIWINTDSKEKIVKYLNQNSELKVKYYIDNEGYLKQETISELSDTDVIIQKLIDGNKLYLLNISSICYMIDIVSGQIIDYRYNDLDSYQTYEYFEDEDKMIIFISENREKKLKNDEIFNSLIELVR